MDVNEIVGRARKAGSLMTRTELLWLCELAKLAPDGLGVEIGVYRGASLIAWSLVRSERGIAIGVDNWQLHNMAPEPVDLKAICQSNLALAGATAQLIDGDSVAVAQPAPDDIAFVFIDSDHFSPAIENDIAAWTPKVRQHGVVAFHDYGRSRFNVTQAIDAWIAREKWIDLGRVETTIGFRKP